MSGTLKIKIANVLERSISNISREKSHNRGRCGYQPKQAHVMPVEKHTFNINTPCQIFPQIGFFRRLDKLSRKERNKGLTANREYVQRDTMQRTVPS
jgi:hypothetical protein